ncbi:MAG: squalene/phytoene synthase family protein [Elusimicrobia bacterium]|nr:squalene/phytoene synthase family protein [Elusimicrobiota bacterium]
MSNFAIAFLFLPAKKRQAIKAVYNFCRAVDDAVDKPGPANPEKAITAWRTEIENLYNGAPSTEIGRALLSPVKNFGLKKEHFLLVIEGVEKDIYTNRYKTFAELQWYLYRVASAVGMLCLGIFGGVSADEYGKWLGYAVQMTNITRDVKEDARMGRIYIPLEDMEKFAVSEKDVLSGKITPQIKSLLSFEAERANKFYAKARAAMPTQNRKSLFPSEIMACVYEALLSKIESAGFGVCAPKLNFAEKITCIIKARRNTYD